MKKLTILFGLSCFFLGYYSHKLSSQPDRKKAQLVLETAAMYGFIAAKRGESLSDILHTVEQWTAPTAKPKSKKSVVQ